MGNGSFLLAGFFGALAWIYFRQWLATPTSVRPDAVVFVFSLMLGTPLMGAGAGFLALVAARAARPRFHAWGRRTLDSVRARRSSRTGRPRRGA